jgi:hypothetical protein
MLSSLSLANERIAGTMSEGRWWDSTAFPAETLAARMGPSRRYLLWVLAWGKYNANSLALGGVVLLPLGKRVGKRKIGPPNFSGRITPNNV